MREHSKEKKYRGIVGLTLKAFRKATKTTHTIEASLFIKENVEFKWNHHIIENRITKVNVLY